MDSMQINHLETYLKEYLNLDDKKHINHHRQLETLTTGQALIITTLLDLVIDQQSIINRLKALERDKDRIIIPGV